MILQVIVIIRANIGNLAICMRVEYYLFYKVSTQLYVILIFLRYESNNLLSKELSILFLTHDIKKLELYLSKHEKSFAV